jgi:hypothetical protein
MNKKKYRPDPFFYRLKAAADEARGKKAELDAYVAATKQLSEAERLYAIDHGMPAPALLEKRTTLSKSVYAAAIASGKPLPVTKTTTPTRRAGIVCGVDVGLVTRIR